MEAQSHSITLLLTNDDGIQSEGLRVLRRTLIARGYTVHVVAPERERSAVGHSITLHKPLRVGKVEIDRQFEGWFVTGTPADCVKLALVELLDRRPDIVISGINPGANVGINLNYSGTVAGAREAALGGLKAMAVSLQFSGAPPATPHYEYAARIVADLVPLVYRQPTAPGVFFNVNIPARVAQAPTTVRPGRQGKVYVEDVFEKRIDLRGRNYYWQSVSPLPGSVDADSDCALLHAGRITITPVRCDMTDEQLLEQMNTWDLEGVGRIVDAPRPSEG